MFPSFFFFLSKSSSAFLVSEYTRTAITMEEGSRLDIHGLVVTHYCAPDLTIQDVVTWVRECPVPNVPEVFRPTILHPVLFSDIHQPLQACRLPNANPS
jgi:hypothetical protein